MDFFAKGKRSVVYLKDGNIIKREWAGCKAINRIDNEAKWLKKLNRHGIGPRIISANEKEIVMEKIDGLPIIEWMKKSSREKIIAIVKDIIGQCRILDEMHVNKDEMTNPYKHIIITRLEKPVMIDFERCRHSESPKNVTQFCQFLASGKIRKILDEKGILIDEKNLRAALICYKREQNKENLEYIKRAFTFHL